MKDYVDILIKAFIQCPSESLKDILIEQEVDYNGNAVGFDLANAIWNRIYNATIQR